MLQLFFQVQSHEDPLGSQLQLYKELFEERLLENTGNFYQKEAQKLYEQNDVSNYMIKVCFLLCSTNYLPYHFLAFFPSGHFL